MQTTRSVAVPEKKKRAEVREFWNPERLLRRLARFGDHSGRESTRTIVYEIERSSSVCSEGTSVEVRDEYDGKLSDGYCAESRCGYRADAGADLQAILHESTLNKEEEERRSRRKD